MTEAFKPHFTSELQYAKVPDSDYFVVLRDCTWRLTEDTHVTVPRGFFTDLASTPEFLHAVIPPQGVYSSSAVFHDFMCEYLSLTTKGKPHSITRRLADDIFLEMMLVHKVPINMCKLLYEGVVTFRIFKGLDKPSTTRRKRDLEAKWWKDNQEYGNARST